MNRPPRAIQNNVVRNIQNNVVHNIQNISACVLPEVLPALLNPYVVLVRCLPQKFSLSFHQSGLERSSTFNNCSSKYTLYFETDCRAQHLILFNFALIITQPPLSRASSVSEIASSPRLYYAKINLHVSLFMTARFYKQWD